MIDAAPTKAKPGTAQVAQRFLSHYQARGYQVIPGSSLLDPSVPMSFVMSAGLVQVETSAMSQGGRTGSRYTLLQNCFRYFDLEQVGNSQIHLSLFQMPGAFTFGPIDKAAHIEQIWSLLVDVYGLPPDRLWATWFAGDTVAGRAFDPDLETRQAWLDVGLPGERIVGLGAGHNFWKQGASVVGELHAPKCGPNTEVFFDRGEAYHCGPACAPGCRCGRFVEFLNTLFISTHLDEPSGRIAPLEEPFTETVVGAERIAMLLQGAASVFDIDSIRPLVEHIRAWKREPCASGSLSMQHARVIADHLRALLFLTADGAPPPGKGGRARLMRKLAREMFTAQKLMHIDDPAFVRSLVGRAVDLYSSRHAGLSSASARLLANLDAERDRFERALQSGFRRLERLLTRRGYNQVSGEEMVQLEKEYGLPEPLLKAALHRRQVDFDPRAYRTARKAWYQTMTGAD
ncbi:MAG: hypothetical protein JW934_02250 [Anaerolineae bacterium]|nr:hypothetical protein [Anaerolineae bacterium]